LTELENKFLGFRLDGTVGQDGTVANAYGCTCVCSTFKKDCPVTFTLSAKRENNRQFLAISSKHDVHNHATDNDAYKLYPTVRRLNTEERKRHEEMVCVIVHLFVFLVVEICTKQIQCG